MALLAMPFVIANLGGEMVYILEQRLRAQSIPGEKSVKVLHDVVRTMFSGKFVSEVFKPAEIYTNVSTRQIFERLAHSSIMRLSESSMDKLYDLMTMGFKYQLLSCRNAADILQVTLTHTETIRACITDPQVIDMVFSAEALIKNHYKNLTSGDWAQLRQALCRFFHDRRIKVSLFLQEGIQNADGRIALAANVPKHHGSIGSIRMFDSQGGSVESLQVSLAEGSQNPDHPVKLGANLYAKDRPAVKRPGSAAKKSGVTQPGVASTSGSAALPPGGSSLPPPGALSFGGGGASMNFLAKNEGQNEFLRNSRSAGEAKQELNLLASLIGPSAKPSDNFKINLFPEPLPSSGSPIPSRGHHVDTITIDNSSGSKTKELKNIMKSFDDLNVSPKGSAKGKKPVVQEEEEDDLLDLMDAA